MIQKLWIKALVIFVLVTTSSILIRSLVMGNEYILKENIVQHVLFAAGMTFIFTFLKPLISRID